jgi:hypothetical protein
MTLEIGNIVRVRRSTNEMLDWFYGGAMGTIVRIHKRKKHPYDVAFPDHKVYSFNEAELDLIKEN